MRTLTPWLLLPLLVGCGANYSFNSNLDGDAIDDYFKAGSVKLIDAESALAAKRDLGLIEATSCQEQVNQAPADAAEARTLLRQQAADMGANAIWVKECINLESDQQCHSAVMCIAKALVIHES